MSDTKVLARISLDTSSFMVDSVSINDILGFLGLPAFKSSDELTVGYMAQLDQRMFSVHGLSFSVRVTELQLVFGADVDPSSVTVGEMSVVGDLENNDRFCSFFDHNFRKVRVYISGRGMDFCREHFLYKDTIDFDRYLLNLYCKFDGQHNFRFTRNDIAVDVFNCDQDIIQQIYTEFIKAQIDEDYTTFGKPLNFVFTNRSRSSTSSFKFDFRVNSDQRTIYIGSKNSDQLLRIYDKYMEKTLPDGGLDSSITYFDQIKTEDIKTWTRFELQLRNKKACSVATEHVLESPFGFMGHVGSTFSPAPRSRSNKPAVPFPFWVDYFSQFENVPFVLNNHFVQLDDSPLDKSNASLSRSRVAFSTLGVVNKFDSVYLFLLSQSVLVLNGSKFPMYSKQSLKFYENLTVLGYDNDGLHDLDYHFNDQFDLFFPNSSFYTDDQIFEFLQNSNIDII